MFDTDRVGGCSSERTRRLENRQNRVVPLLFICRSVAQQALEDTSSSTLWQKACWKSWNRMKGDIDLSTLVDCMWRLKHEVCVDRQSIVSNAVLSVIQMRSICERVSPPLWDSSNAFFLLERCSRPFSVFTIITTRQLRFSHSLLWPSFSPASVATLCLSHTFLSHHHEHVWQIVEYRTDSRK